MSELTMNESNNAEQQNKEKVIQIALNLKTHGIYNPINTNIAKFLKAKRKAYKEFKVQ